MGRKDAARGGVYPNAWHIPGGGLEEGETLEDAAIREVYEEIGLRLEKSQLSPLGPVFHGESLKTLKSGEQVNCQMEFHEFAVRLPHTASQLVNMVKPGDDLVELRCFPLTELHNVELIPGAVEFYKEVGYI